MEERRLAQRYMVPLPAVVKGVTDDKEVLEAKTRDISTHGVYLTADQPLTVGLNFNLSVILPKNVTHGSEVVLDARATVVRVDDPKHTGEATGFGIAASIVKYSISHVAVGFALHRAEQAPVGENRPAASALERF
jgi:hypothetical protein